MGAPEIYLYGWGQSLQKVTVILRIFPAKPENKKRYRLKSPEGQQVRQAAHRFH
jgi:hypothetical protein